MDDGYNRMFMYQHLAEIKGQNNLCDCKGCNHNRSGQCLDKPLLSNPFKQTGCLKTATVLQQEVGK